MKIIGQPGTLMYIPCITRFHIFPGHGKITPSLGMAIFLKHKTTMI